MSTNKNDLRKTLYSTSVVEALYEHMGPFFDDAHIPYEEKEDETKAILEVIIRAACMVNEDI